MRPRPQGAVRRRFSVRNCSAALLLAGCLVALSGAAAGAPAPGLIAAYAFDESSGTTAIDSSGNAKDGTFAGSATRTAGRFGSAASLNGSSARVDLPGLGTFYKAGSRSRPG